MGDELIIAIELRGMGDATGGLGQLANAVRRVNSPIRQAATNLKQQAQATRQTAAQYAKAYGPMQRYLNARQRFLSMQQTGTGVQRFDAYQSMMGAWGRLQKAQQPGMSGFGKALQNFIYSSRFSVSKSGGFALQPLIGRSLALLAHAGPAGTILAAGLAAATAGVLILKGAAESAAAAMKQFRDTQLSTGGTAAETQAGLTLAGALGLDPGEVRAAAGQFAAQLGSNPYARSYFAQKGIADPMGHTPLGNMDRMRQFWRAIDRMRSATEQDTIQMIRMAPALEPFARIRDVSEDVYRAMKLQAQGMAAFYGDPTLKRTMADFGVNMERIRGGLGMLWDMLGSFVATYVNNWMKTLDAFFRWLANMLNGFGANIKIPSMDENTAAVRDNTVAMRDFQRQITGGGDRARGAVPTAFRGKSMDEGLAGAVRMGAFSL